MRKCYFCGMTKNLKAVWLEDGDAPDGCINTSCCYKCYNNPSNAMEDAPLDSVEWYTTDYTWNPKKQ